MMKESQRAQWMVGCSEQRRFASRFLELLVACLACVLVTGCAASGSNSQATDGTMSSGNGSGAHQGSGGLGFDDGEGRQEQSSETDPAMRGSGGAAAPGPLPAGRRDALAQSSRQSFPVDVAAPAGACPAARCRVAASPRPHEATSRPAI